MRKQTIRKTSIVFLSLLFLAAIVISATVLQTGTAQAESFEVTIKIFSSDGYGTGKVEVDGQTLESSDTELKISVDEAESLAVKATPDEGFIFQFWCTTGSNRTPNNAVSMKSEDTFTYEECVAFGDSPTLYAVFITRQDEQENYKFPLSYDENLGEVYFFMGNSKISDENVKKHGLLVPNGGFDVPWTVRTALNRVIVNASYFTLVPFTKDSLTSSLDDKTPVSSVFKGFYADWYTSGLAATGSPKAFPTILCSSATDVPGLETSFNQKEELDIAHVIKSQCSPSDGSFSFSSPISNRYWYIKGGNPNTSSTISFQGELIAEFEETAIVPQMTITPSILGDEQSPIVTSDILSTIKLPFGNAGSVRVKLDKIPNAEKEDYTVVIQKQRELTTGDFVTDESVSVADIGTGYVFEVSDIKVNTNVLISRDYGDGYHEDPIVIQIRFEYNENLEDILAKDSAPITIVDGQEQWYYDPQFNGADSMAFTSSISYPEEYPADKNYDMSQLHLQVKGSGVFTFEFYIDGLQINSLYRSVAIYKTGSPIVASEYQNNTSGQKRLGGGGACGTGLPEFLGPHILDSDCVADLAGNQYWFVATIKVDVEDVSTVTDIYLAHVVAGASAMYHEWALPHTVMSMRNLAFYQGASDVSWGIYGDSDGSKASYGTITATVNGEVQQELKNTSSGTKVTFSVQPQTEYKFYGWSDGENILSTDQEFIYTVRGKSNEQVSQTKIYAVIAPESEPYAYRNGGKFYLKDDLQNALNNATNNRDVIVLCDVIFEGDITIPALVNLVLPHNEAGDYYTEGTSTTASATLSWKNPKYSTPYVTFTYSGAMTVNGTLQVGAVVNYTDQPYSGLTSGAYSHFINNGTVTVASGGYVDIYGLVTGSGSITVQSGGKIAQPFLILDYAGGTNTLGLYMEEQTPFNRYAMINIQCTGGVTIEYMGELLGHASLYAMGSIFVASAPVISYKTSFDDPRVLGLITLTPGGSAHFVYTEESGVISTDRNGTQWIGKTKLTITGGATANHMSLNVGFEITTEDVIAFAVPYNYDITIKDGKFAINGSFKLMPGASLTVEQSATLDINNNFFVYDGLVQSSMSGRYYPTATQLNSAQYSTNGKLIVDGTLNINQTACFLGAIQTNGTGIINVQEGATLSGKLIDGAATPYDCNYMEYESSAKVWDSAHNQMCTLKPGKYTAVQCASWTLPSVTVSYEDHDFGSEDAMKSHVDHASSETYKHDGKTAEVKNMVGSWKVEHGDSHLLDWTYNAEKDTLPSADTHHTTITRQCTELGCDHSETRELLYAPASWGDITYTGDNLTDDELKAAINKLFGSGYDLFATAGGSLSHGTILEVNGTGYDVTVTLAKGFWVSGENYSTDKLDKQLKINVIAAQLTAANVDKIANVTYNGKEQKPQIKVTYNGRELTLDTHYNVDYRDNTNVGQATITVTAVDKNYAGKFEVHFTIDPLDITSAQLQGIEDSYEYSGKPQKPEEFDVIATGNLTVPKGDYDVSYSHNGGDAACTKLGKVTVTVTMKEDKNFTGSASKTFDITAANANNAQVTVNGEYTYSGSAQTPDSDNVQVTLAGFDTLVHEQDYTFAATSNTNAGMATVTVTFTGNFTGSATGTFQIKQKDISVLTFGGVDASYVYTGKAIKPEPTVQFNEIPLVKEQDFTVTYNSDSDGEACIAVGTVTVTVTAKDGNYTGSKTLTYGITIKDAAEAQIQVTGSYVYNSQTQTAALTVTLDNYTITDNDYTVDYGASDRVNVGTVNFTVNFTGNFSGSKQLSFQITQAKVVVKPQAAQSPEGEDQVALNYDIEGTMYNQDEATLRGGITLKLDGELSAKHAGDTLKIVVVLDQTVKGKLSNYDIDVSQTADYTVTEAVFGEVTVSADVNVPYDGKEHPITVSGQPEHAVTEIKYTLKGEPFEGDPKDVGEYSVTVRITLASYHEYSVTRTVTIRAAQLTVQINKQTTTFNGKQQRPDSAATNWKVLGVAQGESVTLTLEASLTDVGKTDIVATLVEGDNTKLSNYTYDKASLTLKDGFEVTAKSVDDLTFGGVNASYEYTGNAIHPQPTVKFGEISLEQEQDFTVAYGGNTTVVGGGTVTVNGRGNYTGSKQLTFTITAKDASGAQVTVTDPQSYVYNGTNQTVKLTVTLANYAITASDYTVEYADGADRTNVGTVNFTVNFTGNFSGKVDKLTFTVTAKNATLNIEEQRVTFDRNPHDAAQLRHSFADVLPGDEQDITVTLKGSGTNVGNYNVTAEFGGDKAGNYNFTVNGDGKLVIEAATIDSVRVTSTHIYNGTEQTPELEVKAGSLTLQQGEYTVGYRGNRSDVGTVTVTVQANGDNFVGNAQTQFGIDKATITVTVDDKSSVYGEPFDDNFTFEASGICDKDKESLFVKDYITLSCDASVSKVVNTYDITAKVGDVQPDNYNIVIGKQGTYTVTARDVTVNVFDQNGVYNRDHDYAFVSTKWQLAQDSTMAYNQDPSVLQVVLAKPTMTGAGSYKIVPSYTNPNYNVTFVGSWQGSDEHQGKAGTYTVDKLTLIDGENDAWFVLQVNGRDFNEQHPELYKYAGEAYDLTAIVYVGEDEVTATVDPGTLDRIGIHQVTVTIQDTNYQGSKTYNVELVGDDGYSQNLHEVLQALNELVGNVTADTLSSSDEHFAIVKGIESQLSKLNEDEKQLGADELAKYQAIVDAWNNAAAIDDSVIETAKALADAPIKWLFAISALNVLLSALYVVGKGGQL